MSTNAVPVVRPTIAYSRPVCGSVQPHTSLPLPPPICACGRNDNKSMSRQGYSPARIAARPAGPRRSRQHRLFAAAARADGEHGQLLLQVDALTGGAGGRASLARQVLEVPAAGPACVFEQWHALLLRISDWGL